MPNFCRLLIAALLLTGTPVYAGQLTLAWDPNTDSNIAGYKLAYGTSSRSYTTTLDVGTVTTYTVTGLTPGQQYFFAAYAYNTGNVMSPPSAEVSGIVPCVDSLTSNTLSFGASGGSGTASVSATACNWTATSNVNWLTVTGGSNGNGNGTVTFSVGANASTTVRAATVSVGGRTVTVVQNGDDMSGDGRPDVIWLNDSTRQASVWNMGGATGTTMLSWSYLSSVGVPGWTVAGTGDFDGDGHPDVIWQNDSTRQVVIWFMGGTEGTTMLTWTYISSAGVPGWTIVGVGDMNGDGHPDIVWQNDSTRQVTVWYMGGVDGTTMLSWSYLSSSGVPGWKVAALGDFDRDGHVDVVWQNDSTRQVSVWYMGGPQGTDMLGWNYISSAGVPGWSIAGSADFNADGRPDIVWQNDSTRQVSIWYMGGGQGNTMTSWDYLSSAGVPGWHVIVR